MCDKCGVPHENQEEFNEFMQNPINRLLVEDILARGLVEITAKIIAEEAAEEAAEN